MLPPEYQERLRPLLPKCPHPPRPSLDAVLKKLETVSLENLKQTDLQVLARAASQLVGDSSTWVAGAKKETLLSTLLHGEYHEAVLAMMLGRQ